MSTRVCRRREGIIYTKKGEFKEKKLKATVFFLKKEKKRYKKKKSA